MKRRMKYSVGMVVLALSYGFNAHAANEYMTDQTVFQGSHCHALHGSQTSRLTHNVDWLTNSSAASTWVTCPLTRDSVQKSGAPRARVRVYRPSGNTALDCQFVGRSLGGTTWIRNASAPTGESYVDMTLPGNSAGAAFAVRCRLPGHARIIKIVLDE